MKFDFGLWIPPIVSAVTTSFIAWTTFAFSAGTQYTRIQDAAVAINLRLDEAERKIDVLGKNWKAHFEGQETEEKLALQKLTDELLASQRETKIELGYLKEQIAKMSSQVGRYIERRNS